MNKSLQKTIDKFLKERRKSDEGWAVVEDEDIEQLYSIISKLIQLKCEPDLDGDYPIECDLINRRKQHYVLDPSMLRMKYKLDLDNIHTLSLLSSHLTERITKAIQIMEYDKAEITITKIKDFIKITGLSKGQYIFLNPINYAWIRQRGRDDLDLIEDKDLLQQGIMAKLDGIFIVSSKEIPKNTIRLSK